MLCFFHWIWLLAMYFNQAKHLLTKKCVEGSHCTSSLLLVQVRFDPNCVYIIMACQRDDDDSATVTQWRLLLGNYLTEFQKTGPRDNSSSSFKAHPTGLTALQTDILCLRQQRHHQQDSVMYLKFPLLIIFHLSAHLAGRSSSYQRGRSHI